MCLGHTWRKIFKKCQKLRHPTSTLTLLHNNPIGLLSIYCDSNIHEGWNKEFDTAALPHTISHGFLLTRLSCLTCQTPGFLCPSIWMVQGIPCSIHSCSIWQVAHIIREQGTWQRRASNRLRQKFCEKFSAAFVKPLGKWQSSMIDVFLEMWGDVLQSQVSTHQYQGMFQTASKAKPPFVCGSAWILSGWFMALPACKSCKQGKNLVTGQMDRNASCSSGPSGLFSQGSSLLIHRRPCFI